MIRAFLTRLLLNLPIEFEPDHSNWQAWRDAVKSWRLSAERQLQERASEAIARRQA